MLPAWKRKLIVHLATYTRHSGRQIARLVAVSHDTVRRILSGGPAVPAVAKKRPDRQIHQGGDILLPGFNPKEQPVRCPKCGGLVYLPCLKCAAAAHLAEEQALRRQAMTAPDAEKEGE